MGLLLSVLVVCVGVLEVIACVRHFQSGYLTLWAPHNVVPGCTNIHELWRTKPTSDSDCFTTPGEITSSDDSLYLANSVQYYHGQLDIFSHEKISELTHEEILFSDTDGADNAPGIDSALSSRQNVFGSREIDGNDIYFDDITLCGNNSGLRHCHNSQNIDVPSNDTFSLDTTETNLPSCAHAESLLQQRFVSYSDNLVDSEESASHDKPLDSEIFKITSSQQVIEKSSEEPNNHTLISSPSREIGTVFPVGSGFKSYSAELYSEVDPPNEQHANETGGFRKKFSAEAGDVVTENSIFCCDKIKTFPRDCKDNFVASTDELSQIVDVETYSPAPYTSASSIETELYQILEQAPSCNLKDESDLILKKNGKEDTYVVGPNVSTPGTPRKSKADINWPTFTAVPVIKRPSVPLTTETLTSFENIGIIDDITDVSFDSKNTGVSEKSEKTCERPVITEGKIISVQEEVGKMLDSEEIYSAADENKDNVGDSISDLDILEESPISVIPGNEFSKKEIMLKRRRSYKSKRQSSSLESASGSEIDDISLSEERTGVRESRIRLRKSSKTNSAEDAAYVEKAQISSSYLSRSLSYPDSNSVRKLLQNSQTSSEVKPEVLGHNPRNKCLMAGNLATGVKTVDEKIVEQLDDNVIKDERKNIISSVTPPPDNSSVTDIAPTNEDVSESEKKTSSKEAFWLIFSGEYTKAMSKDWHSGHFCCWQCDESLTGQRYVLRDDHPYCIKCYESVFANVCEECNKTIGIDSKDLSYKDKHWHEACFLCNKCRISLVDKQFGSKADKIYCGNCYDAQFASRCDGCGEIFRAGTKKMEYKTRQWHEKCFCCCVCKTAIGTKSFIPREQEIYCATCYEEKFATRCVKCRKIITSGGVTYKNEPWHRECFTCTNCNTSLAGQRFTSRDEKPYCAECFGELFAKRCTACSKPITGIGGTRFISFEDRHWHNDCFICAACKTSLVGRGFITDADDIICPECAKQKLM